MTNTPPPTPAPVLVTIAGVRPGTHLTKTYYLDPADQTTIRRREAANVRDFIFVREPVSSVAELAAELADMSAAPNLALVRGVPIPLANRRTKDQVQTDPAGTHLIIVDRDGYDLPPGVCPLTDPLGAIRAARDTMGHPCFREAACVGILSASAGMAKAKGVDGAPPSFTYLTPGAKAPGRARLVFLADRPITDTALRAWLKELKEDPTPGNPIQLQYTAAPVFEDGLRDPIPTRVWHLPGDERLVIPAHIPTPAAEAEAAARAERDHAAAVEVARAAREYARAHPAPRSPGAQRRMDWRQGFDAPGFLRALGYRVGRIHGKKMPCACPNAAAHTDGRGKGQDMSTALIMKPDSSWILVCKHAHCDDISLWTLCQENPDTADQYASREWVPNTATITQVRHLRFRAQAAPSPSPSGSQAAPTGRVSLTPEAAAAADEALAVERERLVAATNARLEAREARTDKWVSADTNKRGMAKRVASSPPADNPNSRPKPNPHRKAAMGKSSARRADARLAGNTRMADHFDNITRKLTLCGRNIGTRLIGPSGTFTAPHTCGSRSYCPECAKSAAEEWCERVARGGVESLPRYNGGTATWWSVTINADTVTETWAQYDALDEALKRSAAAAGVPVCSHYEDEPGYDEPSPSANHDTPTVSATITVCAILGPDTTTWAPPVAGEWQRIYTVPVSTPPALGLPSWDIANSTAWGATVAIAAWDLSYQEPTGLRLWLSNAASIAAEEAILATGRKQWRAHRPNRLWSSLFPPIPPDNERIAEVLDTLDLDTRVATGDMTDAAAAAAAAIAETAAKRRIDAAEKNPLGAQPIPFARASRAEDACEKRKAWADAAVASPPRDVDDWESFKSRESDAAREARLAYLEFLEGELRAVGAWGAAHAARARAAHAQGPPAMAGVGR